MLKHRMFDIVSFAGDDYYPRCDTPIHDYKPSLCWEAIRTRAEVKTVTFTRVILSLLYTPLFLSRYQNLSSRLSFTLLKGCLVEIR